MRLGRGSAVLRVGLEAGLRDADPHTGHGKVWRHLLAELAAMPSVKLVDRGRADVWLAGTGAPPPDGRPLVVQVHEVGWDTPALRGFLDRGFAQHMEGLVRGALEVASEVITPSQVARRQVIESYSWAPERVHAVPHGVDHELFRPDRRGGRDLAGGPYVLFVGVLHPRKNFAAVRQAVADLARLGLPHVLVMVGNLAADPRALEFQRQARVELVGEPKRIVGLSQLPSPDLAALMAGADVFCLPSFFEGFGLPVLEAMACGAPVVVSDRGALPEVVGDAGLVVSPEPAAVSQAVRRVLTEPDLAHTLGRAAVQRAAGFCWRRTAAGWLEVLERAA